MKYLICIFILVICISCSKENLKKIDAKDITEKELKSINFGEVDQFPLFKNCDETASRQTQMVCFEQELHKWLRPYLDSIPYQVLERDSINLNLSILPNGKINLDSVSSNVELSDVFYDIFDQSPHIYPAQKRGIPVKVSLQLPIVLDTKYD